MLIAETLSRAADEYPTAYNDVLSMLESPSNYEIREGLLSFLARVRPSSELLLNWCLKLLSIGGSRSIEANGQVVLAAELLGTHFGGG